MGDLPYACGGPTGPTDTGRPVIVCLNIMQPNRTGPNLDSRLTNTFRHLIRVAPSGPYFTLRWNCSTPSASQRTACGRLLTLDGQLFVCLCIIQPNRTGPNLDSRQKMCFVTFWPLRGHTVKTSRGACCPACTAVRTCSCTPTDTGGRHLSMDF